MISALLAQLKTCPSRDRVEQLLPQDVHRVVLRKLEQVHARRRSRQPSATCAAGAAAGVSAAAVTRLQMHTLDAKRRLEDLEAEERRPRAASDEEEKISPLLRRERAQRAPERSNIGLRAVVASAVLSARLEARYVEVSIAATEQELHLPRREHAHERRVHEGLETAQEGACLRRDGPVEVETRDEADVGLPARGL